MLLRRMREQKGQIIILLGHRDEELASAEEVRSPFLAECKNMRSRLVLATRQPLIVSLARAEGIRVIDRTKQLKQLLHNHPRQPEALRVFSPHVWRQQLKSRLQQIGLLSMPKVRIFALVSLSVILFGFVLLRLLPSAEIRVWARQESVSQTANIFLVSGTGAMEGIPQRVRTMPLVPLRVTVSRALTFDHISNESLGTAATMRLTIVNKADEQYSLRAGTRVTNQAGMVFKLEEPAIIPSKGEVTVRAKAEDVDLFGQVIGERGNVLPGLKWEIPGLSPEERAKVYGENRTAATGGRTETRTVFLQKDLDLAKLTLEGDLVAVSKQLIKEELAERNAQHADQKLTLLDYSQLTSVAFSGFVLPTEFLGQTVTSVPLEGSVVYTMYAYDAQAILNLLSKELLSHVREGKEIVRDTLSFDHLDVRVIAFDDDLKWIKLTVELVGADRYILDPLSPMGALFGKRVREKVKGLPKGEALRIIKNMPEVEKAEMSLWPPWSGSVPRILSHIAIAPQ